MNLKKLIRLNESKKIISNVIEKIVEKYPKEKVEEEMNKAAKEIVPSNWNETAKTEREWAEKFSKGDFEDQVASGIINRSSKSIGIRLDSSQLADIKTWFFETYEI